VVSGRFRVEDLTDQETAERLVSTFFHLVLGYGLDPLNGGESEKMAFRTQENRKIRPSVGCRENSVSYFDAQVNFTNSFQSEN
jgi:hypothetical protein